MGDKLSLNMSATLSPSGKSRGPVVTIEGKGVKIPVYFSPRRGEDSYLLAYYAEGQRKRERVTKLEDAKKRAKKLIDELATGTVHVQAFSLKQTAAILEAAEILRPLNTTLTDAVRQFAEAQKILSETPLIDAVRFFVKHKELEAKRGALQPITFPVLATKYLQSISGKKSARYVQDQQSKLKRAAKAFTGQLRDIRADDIDAWINGMDGANARTKNNYRLALLTLFSYARDKNHLPRGEKTEAEFATRHEDKKGGTIDIYTPAQFALLLRYVDERFLPFVALGGLAGLRSIEILRLEWQDVWFEKGFIEVGRSKSKTATRRLVPICPALHEWLKPHAKKTGPILPDIRDEFHFTRLFHTSKTSLNDEDGKARLELLHNGLRHSFCSYRLALVKSAAQVALEAGNSPKMLFEHYRELVTEDEGKEWFSLSPKAVKKLHP